MEVETATKPVKKRPVNPQLKTSKEPGPPPVPAGPAPDEPAARGQAPGEGQGKEARDRGLRRVEDHPLGAHTVRGAPATVRAVPDGLPEERPAQAPAVQGPARRAGAPPGPPRRPEQDPERDRRGKHGKHPTPAREHAGALLERKAVERGVGVQHRRAELVPAAPDRGAAAAALAARCRHVPNDENADIRRGSGTTSC